MTDKEFRALVARMFPPEQARAPEKVAAEIRRQVAWLENAGLWEAELRGEDGPGQAG